MREKKNKYYVVWSGVEPGIYDNWTSCKLQIEGFKGAKYKSFESKEEAQEAYHNGYQSYIKTEKSSPSKKKVSVSFLDEKDVGIIWNSICVDAACSGNPGKMEYRGVFTATNQELFHVGPFLKGTNNIGEFLALVHGLAYLKKHKLDLPIYSDSRNAISWIKKKKCKTQLKKETVNKPIFDLIERAEKWLETNTFKTQIIKWETEKWGEIPADFGRK